MPKRDYYKKHSARRVSGFSHGRLKGGSFVSFFKKVNNWLRKNKALSKVANAIGYVFPKAKDVSKGLASLGYGKRRVTHRR